VFHDAIDDQIVVNLEEDKNDPSEREELPFLKDPKIKYSVWSILKDSLGKDLSKMSVPVYFNQPLSVL
jgi:hypothetical protein